MYLEPSRDGGDLTKQLFPKSNHIIWKKVFTGEHLPAAEYLRLFLALNVEASETAIRFISDVSVESPSEIKMVRLVLKTVAELGFREEAAFSAVEAAATAQGLTYCPSDTALVLRTEYSSLPEREAVKIVSQPRLIGGLPCVLAITRHVREIGLDVTVLRPETVLMRSEKLVLADARDVVLAD